MEFVRKKLIIIGGAKCGTTSIAHWLGRHPKLPIGWAKEPCFFTAFARRDFKGPGTPGFPSKPVYDRDAYEAMYDGSGVVWGIDGSTDYLASPVAAEKISQYSQDVEVKLVVILRDPVKRAFSQYAHTRDRRWETKSFVQSLELEEQRRTDGWSPLFHHIHRSRYGEHLLRYLDLFPAESILMLPFEMLKDKISPLREIEQFIGLEPFDYGGLELRNVTGAVEKSRILDRLIRGNSLIKDIAKATVPERFRSAVKEANKTRLQATQADLLAAYDRLEDDIEIARKIVPFDTAHWFHR